MDKSVLHKSVAYFDLIRRHKHLKFNRSIELNWIKNMKMKRTEKITIDTPL